MSSLRSLGAGVGLALILFAGYELYSGHKRAVKDAETKARLEAVARENGGFIGQLATQRELNRQLSEDLKVFAELARKADKRAGISSVSKTTAGIQDKPVVHMVPVPGGPPECRDEYHRFGVIVRPDGTCAMWRKQEFVHKILSIRSGDGKTRIGKEEFFELDPETHAVIPTTGINMKTDFMFADESPAKPPIFHPRLIVGVNHQLAFGAGVELLNLERTERPVLEKLTLSAVGYYDRKNKAGQVGAQLGYRILNSNITVGPFVGVSAPGGGLTTGVGAAIQVTR